MALTDNIVAYWKFDESAGASTADDAASTNDLTKGGSATFDTGKINNATDLEAITNDYWDIADNAALSVQSAFSFSAWVKMESLPAANQNMDICSKHKGSDTNEGYEFVIRNVGESYYLGLRVSPNPNGVDGFIYVSTSATGIATGTWYHVVATYSDVDNRVRFYLNGSQLGNDVACNYGQCDNAAPFRVGCDGDGGSDIDGMVDELGVWSRELTGDEAAELYNGGSGFSYPFIPPPDIIGPFPTHLIP